MNIKFYTSKISSTENFLSLIEKNIIKAGFSFMIISNDAKSQHLKDIVRDIKSHFDIFILLETNIPKSNSFVEKYFFEGFHGIYYTEKSELSETDKNVLKHSTELFPIGSLFLEYSGSKFNDIDEILNMNLIPVLKSCDFQILEYTENKIDNLKKLNRYLKYVPLLGQSKCQYNLGHRLKIKMMLETDNLRQKLMVKNIEDSFNSSGL